MPLENASAQVELLEDLSVQCEQELDQDENWEEAMERRILDKMNKLIEEKLILPQAEIRQRTNALAATFAEVEQSIRSTACSVRDLQSELNNISARISQLETRLFSKLKAVPVSKLDK